MTVKDLMERLRAYPPETPIAVWDLGYGGLNRRVVVEMDGDEEGACLAFGGLAESEPEDEVPA